ncbi:hypothetical protein D3C71_1885260 [compost metagenome]
MQQLFHDGQHIARLHLVQRLLANARVDVRVEEPHDLRAVGHRAIEQRFAHPHLGKVRKGHAAALGICVGLL